MTNFVEREIKRLEEDLGAELRNLRVKQRELKRELAEKAKQLKDVEAQHRRLSGPRPAKYHCLDCWYLRGQAVKTQAEPHEDPVSFDLMVCPVCGRPHETPLD